MRIRCEDYRTDSSGYQASGYEGYDFQKIEFCGSPFVKGGIVKRNMTMITGYIAASKAFSYVGCPTNAAYLDILLSRLIEEIFNLIRDRESKLAES